MAKKKVEAKTKVVEISTEAMTAEVETSAVDSIIIMELPPQVEEQKTEAKGDMHTVYRAVRKKLEAEGLTVNDANPMLTQVRIENDFVKDCEAMIPAIVGAGPEYPAWNFPALIHCVVPRGDNTKTRLEILKNVVRATLVGPPFTVEGLERFMTSIIITDEKDGKAMGVRTSAISLLIRIDRIKKSRR